MAQVTGHRHAFEMPRRIITIASAPGWNARLTSEDAPWEDAKLVTLALWALVEGEGGEPEIVGVVQKGADEELPVGKLTFADEVEGFRGRGLRGVRARGRAYAAALADLAGGPNPPPLL